LPGSHENPVFWFFMLSGFSDHGGWEGVPNRILKKDNNDLTNHSAGNPVGKQAYPAPCHTLDLWWLPGLSASLSLSHPSGRANHKNDGWFFSGFSP